MRHPTAYVKAAQQTSPFKKYQRPPRGHATGGLLFAAYQTSTRIFHQLPFQSETEKSFSFRNGFKASDQVQGQGAGRSIKRSIHGFVSFYRRPATQPLGLRWGFETTSIHFRSPGARVTQSQCKR
jgi:hypothetical protein